MTEPLGYGACLTKDFVFESDGLVLRSGTPFPRERLEQCPEPRLVCSWVAVRDGLLPGKPGSLANNCVDLRLDSQAKKGSCGVDARRLSLRAMAALASRERPGMKFLRKPPGM